MVSPPAPSTRRQRKRTMSAEARKRISQAQKARRAKQKDETAPTEAAPAVATAVAATVKPGRRGVRKGAAKRGRCRILPLREGGFRTHRKSAGWQ
jgi:hypothetical protein